MIFNCYGTNGVTTAATILGKKFTAFPVPSNFIATRLKLFKLPSVHEPLMEFAAPA